MNVLDARWKLTSQYDPASRNICLLLFFNKWLKGLTGDIEGDRCRFRRVAAQMTCEGGIVVVVDDRWDAQTAAPVNVSFLQTDGGAVPQPHQFLIRSAITTLQRHNRVQLHLDNTFTVNAWVGGDAHSFGEERKGRSLKSQGVIWVAQILFWKKMSLTRCLGCGEKQQEAKWGHLHFSSFWINLGIKQGCQNHHHGYT